MHFIVNVFLSYAVINKQGRRGSVLPQALQEQINQESTPLQDIGEVGPPQIVDMYECYSGVEGWKYILVFNIHPIGIAHK